MDEDGPSGAGPGKRQSVFGASVDDIWCAESAHAWSYTQWNQHTCLLITCTQEAIAQQYETLPGCAKVELLYSLVGGQTTVVRPLEALVEQVTV